MKKTALFLLLIHLQCWAKDPISDCNQLIVTLAPNVDSCEAKLFCFERIDQIEWRQVSSPLDCVIGRNGLALGIGLHELRAIDLPMKKEGDGKSPAGIFSLGPIFGNVTSSERDHLKMPYLPLNKDIEGVDDTNSLYYNQIVDISKIDKVDWNSSEKMAEIPLYDLGMVINHNYPNPLSGFGSQIFMHIWRNRSKGTAGCTALSREDLSNVLNFLDKTKNPLIVQLTEDLYKRFQENWRLPMISHSKKHLCNFVDISLVNPNIMLDIRYATSNNFMKMPCYKSAKCFLHKEVALALSNVQKELETIDLGLKVFDGYRPIFVQQLFWDKIQDTRYISNPAEYKGGHTRGTAVDLTLVNKNGDELEMPTDFDDFSEKAHSNSSDATLLAIKNRTLLKEVMARHNFQQLETEWWHFDFVDGLNDQKYPPLDISFEEIEN